MEPPDIPSITNPVDVLLFANTITGGIFGVGTLIALMLIITLSLWDRAKEAAVLAGTTVALVGGVLFAFMNVIQPHYLILFAGLFVVGIIVNHRSKAGLG